MMRSKCAMWVLADASVKVANPLPASASVPVPVPAPVSPRGSLVPCPVINLQCCWRWCRASCFDAANDVQSWVEQIFFSHSLLYHWNVWVFTFQFLVFWSSVIFFLFIFKTNNFELSVCVYLCVDESVVFVCLKVEINKNFAKDAAGVCSSVRFGSALARSPSSNKFCINEIANTM